MAATGELIRLINYVDDINTTLRRIQSSLYGMDADERKKLAEALRNADARLRELLEQVEK
jgi:PAS domain-containing protein